jgi:hypothetical protein
MAVSELESRVRRLTPLEVKHRRTFEILQEEQAYLFVIDLLNDLIFSRPYLLIKVIMTPFDLGFLDGWLGKELEKI